MFKVSDISVRYGEHRALEGATIRVDAGEIVVILGANGAGKSSLLKAIAGTCEGKVQGQVELNGLSLSSLPAETIVVRGIAFVPEGRGIFGDLSVSENLLLGAHSTEARKHQAKNLARVYKLFPKLQERAKQVARTMSGGEQQMVAIGRAIMANPKLLMLDEPSLGLSPLLCKELFQNLSHIRDAGISVLMVEQNAKQSLAISDRAYLLENGTITGEGAAQAMMNDPAVQAAYLGGAQSGAGPRVTHIVVSDEDEETSSVPFQTDQLRDQKYLQPSKLDKSSGSSGQISGVDIGALVARASDLSTPDVKAPSTRSQPYKPVSTPENSSHQHARPQLNTEGEDVQSLLRQFETAAHTAARPGTSANGGKPTQIRTDTIEVHENLPTIPVYKKSKLEVYRRTPAGDLMKVEER